MALACTSSRSALQHRAAAGGLQRHTHMLLLSLQLVWRCRGTDFNDPGDVLVDADCQHTEDKGGMFGSKADMRLHTGFYRAWESVAPAVMPELWKQLQQVSYSAADSCIWGTVPATA